MGEDEDLMTDDTRPVLLRFAWPIILGLGSVILIVLSFILLFQSVRPAEPIRFSSDSASESAVMNQITIDIAGGVVRPGIYRVAFGSRTDDAINAAGGFSGDADMERVGKTVNRASLLSDGAKLYIPQIGDPASLRTGVTVGGTSSKGQETSQTAETALISINAASEAELDRLSGIGPATAKKIIDGRPYGAVEELLIRKILRTDIYEKNKALLSL